MKGRELATGAVEAAFRVHLSEADMSEVSAAVRAAAEIVPATALIKDGALILVNAGFRALVNREMRRA